jgi:hypothetical protein
MARTPLTLLSLLFLATPATAGNGASVEARPIRLQGLDSDGQRTEVLLSFKQIADGQYAVRRRETPVSGGQRRDLYGTATQDDGPLTVVFATRGLSSLGEGESFVGKYRLGPTVVEGHVQTPAWDGSGRRVWTRELGTRARENSQNTGRAEPKRGDADRRLAALQRTAVEVARSELAKNVRESPPRSNAGGRIDVYASVARMPTGRPWCGYFLGFVYTGAARSSGYAFLGTRRLHSVGKTRSFFNYRNYTQRATPARVKAWGELRSQHEVQGAARRYFVLKGSRGQRWAASRKVPCEAFDSYRDLPVRPGDAVIFSSVRSDTKRSSGRGHLALVESYDAASGALVTIEGNSGDGVRRRSRTLQGAARFSVDGFGRPALGDFYSEQP